MKTAKKIGITLLVLALLICLDQWTKALAITYLKDQADIIIIKGVLQLHYLENDGAAFSILEGKTIFFYIITPILCALIAYVSVRLLKSNRFVSLQIVLIFLFAGAIGNYIDRILYQYVVDFIYFSLIDFPVFNVADIYVTCSVVVLMILILFVYKDADFDDLKQFIFPSKKK